MIVAERKPLDEILQSLAGRRCVLVLGCGGCVAVCCSGGEKQAELLADQLLLAAQVRGLDMQVTTDCITRQCDREFFDNMKHDLKEFDVVLSTACGVGVNYMTEVLSASTEGGMAGPFQRVAEDQEQQAFPPIAVCSSPFEVQAELPDQLTPLDGARLVELSGYSATGEAVDGIEELTMFISSSSFHRYGVPDPE